MSGTLRIFKVNGSLEDRRYEGKGTPGLDALRAAIGGGYVERVAVRVDKRLRDAYVDEDGLSKALPPNDRASRITLHGFRIVGVMVVWIPDSRA